MFEHLLTLAIWVPILAGIIVLLTGLITGSEGMLVVVTEVTVRILRAAEGTRAMLAGFRSNAIAGACVASLCFGWLLKERTAP